MSEFDPPTRSEAPHSPVREWGSYRIVGPDGATLCRALTLLAVKDELLAAPMGSRIEVQTAAGWIPIPSSRRESALASLYGELAALVEECGGDPESVELHQWAIRARNELRSQLGALGWSFERGAIGPAKGS